MRLEASHNTACLDRSPVVEENIHDYTGYEVKPYKLIQWMFMNDMGWTMCFASLFITRVCNTASVGVCAQMICHFCLCPNAFIYRALWVFPFFHLFFFLEEAAWSCQGRVLIKTWGGEWHLESDGWKGTKFSLEPTVRNWYRALPLPLSPHKQTTALTYSNERSSFSWTPYLSRRTK